MVCIIQREFYSHLNIDKFQSHYKEGKEVFFKEVKRLEDLVRNVKLMEGWNEEI